MKKEVLYVIFSYTLWGLMPIFWKQLSEVSAFYILVSRITWSFVFCSIVIMATKKTAAFKAVFKNKKEMLLLLLAGIFVATNWGTYIFAVNDGKIIETSIAYYLQPVLSIILGVIIFKEKLNNLQWLAVIFAIIGVFVSIFAYGQLPFIAIVLAVTLTIYYLIKKFVVSEGEVSVVVESLFLLPLTLCFIFYSEYNGIGALGVLHGWEFFLIPLAGILTSLPLMIFSNGIKKIPFSLAGIIMFLSPTLALLIGTFIYNEPFTLSHMITFIFIWASVLFYILGIYKKSKHKKN